MISFFIPIKKISKRVKNKNKKQIKNYKFGLTEIKINQIQKFIYFAKKDGQLKNIKFEVVVSSDDLDIKKFIKKKEWIKFHDRPKHLAKDDCLDQLIQIVPKICRGDHILWTHVTSPLFNHTSYINFIKYYLKNSYMYDSAFTADSLKSFIFNHTKNKWISHQLSKKKKWPRTQDLDKIYLVNNAAFIAKKKVYSKYGNRLGKKILPINISKKTYETFDIDEKKDFNFFSKKLLK